MKISQWAKTFQVPNYVGTPKSIDHQAHIKEFIKKKREQKDWGDINQRNLIKFLSKLI